MKNQLYLHEAIVVALVNIDKETFSATSDEIAAFIEKRELFTDRKAGCTLSEQVMLRATKSSGRYHYLFHQINDQAIQLKSFPPIVASNKKKPIAKLRKDERILR
jgi:hypothetical protein